MNQTETFEKEDLQDSQEKFSDKKLVQISLQNQLKKFMNNFFQTKDESFLVLLEIFIYILLMLI